MLGVKSSTCEFGVWTGTQFNPQPNHRRAGIWILSGEECVRTQESRMRKGMWPVWKCANGPEEQVDMRQGSRLGSENTRHKHISRVE